MSYKVGFLQYSPEFLKPQVNRQRLTQMLTGVEADLLVLPELAISGYYFSDRDQVWEVAEDAQSGPTATMFKQLAQQNNTSYVVGIAELDQAKLYNSSILVNPDGSVHVYRKTHLFYEEKNFFTPGDTGFNVFTAKDGVKVGLMICFDWIFPESARTLALNGAQIIAHSANLVLPWCQQAMFARSLENSVYSITSNRVGTETSGNKFLTFTGASQVLDVKGKTLINASSLESTIKTCDIEVDEANNKMATPLNHLFNDRRPEFYA